MRWKADLPKMPRLPKVPLDLESSGTEPLGPPPPPRAYREENPYESQPVEYRAPSMLVEHRGLALLFIAAAIVFALYCWRAAPRRTAARADSTQIPASAPAQSPIYIEALPDKDR
jgi:hypothetical protein